MSLFVITIVSVYVPWYVHRRVKQSSALLSYGNCIAGGVIFGAMMLHVLPNICTHIMMDGLQRSYPIGLFFASISFLFLFFIDRLFLHPVNSANQKGRDGSTASVQYMLVDDPKNRSEGFIVQSERDLHCNEEEQRVATMPVNTKSTALVFVIAFSMHSFLEGLGLAGMLSWSEVVSYMIGLLSHKWLEAFALGLSMYQASFDKTTRNALLVIYSSLTPIGIILGMLLVGDTFRNETANSYQNFCVTQVLTGLSVGSFLYVTCIEMIPREFEDPDMDLSTIKYKSSCVVAGFLFMAGFALLDVS